MKKKILSLLMVLTLGLTFVFINGPDVKASTNHYTIDYGINTYSGTLSEDDYTLLVWVEGSNISYVKGSTTSNEDYLFQIVFTKAVSIHIHGTGSDGSFSEFHNLEKSRSLEGNISPDFMQIRIGSNEIIYDTERELKISVKLLADLPDNTRPAINGQENFVTNVDDAKPVSFFQQYISAIDETDGAVSVYIKTDNYTANKSVLGTHKVIFGAKDSSDNEATLEVYIRVVDITKPIITGSTAVASIGYKETWNISNFKTTLQVSDNYDTLTNNNITVKTDGYTSNKAKLGTYNIVYAVVDSSGNEGTFTKPVKVIDNVKPTISGPTTIATSNNTVLTESEIRSQLTAHDEIDGNITNKIELVEDNYTGKGNKVGTYTITYRVSDNAGNTHTHVVELQRSDKIPPVFLIKDGVSIQTTPTTPLTFEQIIAILDATNQVTVNATTTFRTLFNDYTNNESEPGLYTWSVEAKSTNGSESVHHMSIQVLDTNEDDETIDVAPDFDLGDWVQDNLVIVSIVAIVLSIGIIIVVYKKIK